MTWPELTPQRAPLSCFGLEHQAADPRCVRCPYQADCRRHMGFRLNRVPLSQATFSFLPAGYEARFSGVDDEDPETPELERVYALCHETVFGRSPADCRMSRHRETILANVRRADCSLRLFLLANMVGHQKMENERVAATALAPIRRFGIRLLTDSRAVERARMYAELCRKQFGTFTLSTLMTLSERNTDDNDLEQRLLDSEVTAGRWLIGHKIHHEGPPYALFYEREEMKLDPYWLAIEDSYKTLVLDHSEPDSREQRRHRHAVAQTIGYLKRHRNISAAVFKARQEIMPQALSRVLEHYGYRPEDFEIEDKPVTDPLEIWVTLGLAIQHFNLLNYLHGEPSLFNRKL
jgi:hypothetical protein